MKRWFKGIFTGFTVEHAYSLLPAVTGFFFFLVASNWGPETGSYDGSGLGRKSARVCNLLVMVVLAQCSSTLRRDTVEDQGLGDECWIVKKTTNQESTDVLKNDAKTTETFSSPRILQRWGNYLWGLVKGEAVILQTTVFAMTLSKYKEKDAQDVTVSLTTVNWLQIHVKKKILNWRKDMLLKLISSYRDEKHLSMAEEHKKWLICLLNKHHSKLQILKEYGRIWRHVQKGYERPHLINSQQHEILHFCTAWVMYLFVKLVLSKCQSGVKMDFYENVAFLKHVGNKYTYLTKIELISIHNKTTATFLLRLSKTLNNSSAVTNIEHILKTKYLNDRIGELLEKYMGSYNTGLVQSSTHWR